MQGSRCRLMKATVAVCERDGKQTCVHLPVGAVLTVVGIRQSGRFIRVIYEGEAALVFPEDVRDRGVLIPEPEPTADDAEYSASLPKHF